MRNRAAADVTSLQHSSPRRRLQQRVAQEIVEAAARVIAEHGPNASMADVASEAGIARATVYRYYASREVLLGAVAALAAREAGERLEAARLDAVELREAVQRAVRALIEVGDSLVAVARDRVAPSEDAIARAVEEPLNRLVERGQADGRLRDDLPVTWLAGMLLALVIAVLVTRPKLGREDAVAAVTSLFLDGAQMRPGPIDPA
jgi:AcrR family transcriptional regulator